MAGLCGLTLAAGAPAETPPGPAGTASGVGFVSRANTPPRKVVVASALADFSGSTEARLNLAARLIDDAARQTAQLYPGQRLDLVILPDFAIRRESGATAADQAVPLAGPVLEALGAKAREHQTWIVAPMTLRETGTEVRISNAAVRPIGSNTEALSRGALLTT